MTGPKTRPTDADVSAFLAGLDDERRRADAVRLDELLRAWTGETPRMWGKDIVGYGSRPFRYASGREGDWMRVGFSPRKRSFSLYITDGLEPHAGLLAKLGKHKTGTCCLYVNRLADVDLDVLGELVRASLSTP